MKQNTLLAALLFLSMYCFAQTDSGFQLKNYKYRTTGFRALSFDFRLSGSDNSNERTGTPASTDKSFDLSPSLLSYYHIISTDKQWHVSNITLSPSYYSRKATNTVSQSKEKRFQNELTWNRTDRFYKSNNFFYELCNYLTGSFLNNREDQPLSNYKHDRLLAKNALSFGIGKGRIEVVQDAQMAVFILDDLRRQGLADIQPDAATYNELAQLITDINNRRVFDFRRRRNYELTRIDSFLRSKGIVRNPDIRTFTTVNDNWALAFNPYRFAGTAYFFRLRPSGGYARFVSETKASTGNFNGNYTSKSLAMAPEIGFTKYIPANLHWQHNLYTNLSWERGWTWSEEQFGGGGPGSTHKQYLDYSFLALNTSYEIVYYPNNRTLLNAGVSVYGEYASKKSWSVTPKLNLSGNYFLGYRTRLTAYFSLEADRYRTFDTMNPVITTTNNRSSFSVGFSHFIL